VAVIGIACRFAGARTAAAYWDNLSAGRETLDDVDASRWPGERGRAGLLEDIDRFDARFFHVSAREAELMDPQHRLFLQEAWTAIEDAGYAPQSLDGRACGVFVGCGSGDYLSLLRASGVPSEAYSLTGNMADVLAARLSYALNLTGPVLSVQTACSSSLVATHLACESLRRGECEMAIAGGVSLMTSFESYKALVETGMLSSDGTCRAFDNRADGFVPAEGVAAVLLKPLAAARRDGDHIYGVITASGINYDGRTNGITAPSAPSQTALAESIYRRFGIDPATISYVEAHGTGTKLGDPIEVAALTDAFRAFTARTQFCAIGSAKTNIGHAMPASGLAGLIKVLLCMQHGELVPSLHVDSLNEHIDFAGSPFVVSTERRPWPSGAGGRRATVSSFGLSGTNAHIVVDEAPAEAGPPVTAGPYTAMLSARDRERLEASAQRLADWIEAHPDARLADVAHTLNTGRDAMKVRTVLTASTLTELQRQLRQPLVEAAAGITVAPVPGGRRISLPTYPFAETRYWAATGAASAPRVASLHELQRRAGSPSEAAVFGARLSGAEPWLREHVINGTATVPGVACLELARAAAGLADLSATGIESVAWVRPLTVSGAARDIELHLRQDAAAVTFAITTAEGIHAQGTLSQAPVRAGVLDLDAIRRRCDAVVDRAELYSRLDAHGLSYGPSFRTVDRVRVGPDELLAELHADATGIVLPPGLLDGALHSIAALSRPSDEPAVPFSLGALEIAGPIPSRCMAHVVRSATHRFQVEIAGEDGRVCARLRDFVMRPIVAAVRDERPLVCRQVWRDEAAGAGSIPRAILLFDRDDRNARRLRDEHGCDVTLITSGDRYEQVSDNHFVIRPDQADGYQATWRALADARRGPSVVVHFWGQENAGDDVQQGLARGFHSVLHLSRLLVDGGAPLVHLHHASQPLHSAIRGLLKTLRIEHPRFRAVTVSCPADHDAVSTILAEAGRADSLEEIEEVRYGSHGRQRRRLEEWNGAAGASPLRDGGVYVITGGGGGIGRLLADHLVKRYRAKVVLAGRSTPAPDRLSAIGAEFIAADVSRYEEVVSLMAATKARFGAIHGVFHCAGVLRDALAMRKTAEQAAAVIAPKVLGCLNIEAATRHEDLDFIALCSSISAVFGNAGQCDYAFANAFLDDFAALHSERMVSIDWPLWRDGGMRVDDSVERALRDRSGLEALSTIAGLETLTHLLGAGDPCPVVLPGDRVRLRAALGLTPPAAAIATAPATDVTGAVLSKVTALAAAVLKVSVSDLAPDEDVSDFGFDSITFTELANRVNDTFGATVTPAAFFEHTTLAAFTAYLCDEHGDHVRRHVTAAAPQPSPSTPVPRPVAGPRTPAVAAPSHDRDPIAIVGMSGRMPRSADLSEFWSHLAAGHDLIEEIPGDRWDWRAIYGDPAVDRNKTTAKWGGFMPDADKFDHQFFGISPKEAELMDPQQRIFLESVWSAIEDAGYKATDLSGTRTGVFAGVASSDYYELIRDRLAALDPHVTTGVSHSFLANRVSYLLNLRGPSEPIDTACSSALVAIHRAVEAIRSDSCDMALAGGVNVMASPSLSIAFNNAGMLSADGRCKTFDARANGYVRGEGVGVVMLKPLSRAMADGDHVHALVLGTAENHGGHAASMTAPNPAAQADVIIHACERANIAPDTIAYVETHGTGTSLGDPIEINGLKLAFIELAKRNGVELVPGACGIGSVKTNVGHLETAAGMAGLFKVVLAMQHGVLPATLHFESLNPYINLEGTPFSVVSAARPFDAVRPGVPRRAGLSSFGMGGSNAHLIIEEHVAAPGRSWDGSPQLVVLSAKNEDRLRAYAASLARHLDTQTPDLAAVAATLWHGRVAMEQRIAIVATSLDDLRAQLRRFVDEGAFAGLACGAAGDGSATRRLLGAAAGQALVATAVRNRELGTIAELWVAGADLDAVDLFAGLRPTRISLPTYPFARVRHWVTGDAAVIVKSAPPAERRDERPEPVALDIEAYLTGLVAAEAKIPIEDIVADRPLEAYGIDSLMVVSLTRELEKTFGELSKTLLFEHQTIRALGGYLAKHHGQRLEPGTGKREPAVVAPQSVATPPRVRREVVAEDDVAIIGVAGRYPMARDLDEFWDNLTAGRDCISEIPLERWDYRRYYDPEKGKLDRVYSKWGGFLDDVDKFDPLFFNISPKEAELLDPQERLFLETSWHTLEDAGYSRAALAGRKVGVYVGVMYGEYQLFGAEELMRGHVVAPRSTYASFANRVSYFLDFHGPSMALDTMCSSSLTAVHLACESLRRGESEVALAGGVNVSIHPLKYFQLSQGRFAATDGRCRSFGAGGDGYVPGEGVGAVLLKPLRQAIADGDRIYAVIKGSSINHGGKTNGYTVPNPVAQAALIAETIEKSGVDPATISYVEAHGTGTSLGDPIEMTSLVNAFAMESREQPCAIGSVKSNIGHLESAAGIAGLTKVLLQLQHGQLVPSLHADPPNPNIRFDKLPFRVQRQVEEWRAGADVRRAAISSFGAGGSNAHLVIEEHVPPVAVPDAQRRPQVIVLSARTPSQLQEMAARLRDALDDSMSLADVAFTLQEGREAMRERIAFVAASVGEAREQLKRWQAGDALLHDDSGELAEAARRWAGGGRVDWTALRGGHPGRRLRLPLYPFARERYWIPRPATEITLRGDEFYLRDHVIGGRKMLPGVAYLDLVRQAVPQSAARFTGITWLRPLVVDDRPVEARVDLREEVAGTVFDVRTGDQLHATGRIELLDASHRPPAIDVAAIKLRCAQTTSGAAHYDLMASLGMHYGPSMRAVVALHAGADESIADLEVPAALLLGASAEWLPAVLDGALHAVAALNAGAVDGVTYVPYAMGEVSIFAPLPHRCHAYARPSGSAFDIDIVDTAGAVCVALRGFAVRALPHAAPSLKAPSPTAVPAASAPVASTDETVWFQPVWNDEPAGSGPMPAGPVLLFDADDSRAAAISERLGSRVEVATRDNAAEVLSRLRDGSLQPALVIHLWSLVPVSDHTAAEECGVYSLLRAIQASAQPLSILYVHAEHPAYAGVAPFLRSMRAEEPNFRFKTVRLEDSSRAVDVVDVEFRALDGTEVRYVGGTRQVKRLAEMPAPSGPSRLRPNAVYLVTGGGGALGQAVARYLEREWQATVVCTGRSGQAGPRFIPADVTSAEDMRGAIVAVRERFGALHGVFHCAGILRDGLVRRKTEADFRAVVAPKVGGAITLAELTRELDLECFVAFSSIAGIFGNVGQADYAYANAVVDALPSTLTINWPLWAEGGMRPDAGTIEWLRRNTGLAPLDLTGGLQAFDAAMRSALHQLVVLHGDPSRLRALTAAPQSAPPAKDPAAAIGPAARQYAQSLVTRVLARELKLSPSSIQARESFEKYGIDSVSILNMTRTLEEDFGELPKTLLYEHESVADLAEYLVTNHGGVIAAKSGATSEAAAPAAAVVAAPVTKTLAAAPMDASAAPTESEIAIVGVAGRYPMAPDLDAFWDNLRAGKDCITEIPAERWDHHQSGAARWGGFIGDVDKFDPAAFHISPREASCMDPQERLFLQTAWHALEDAGYARSAVQHREIGVYVGVMWGEYQLYGPQQAASGNLLVPGSSYASIANRVSFFFNLHGPSLAVDTMCSSSLTAIHLAADAIRRGECEMAIAGGVNVSIHPQKYRQLSQGNFTSSDGRCRSFGAGGDGYVPGEGVGAVVLKPLARAIADGDPIYATIKGSWINHGGRTSGYTVPNPNAQAQLVAKALARAGVEPSTISYLEAHGTGTSLGDPIEIAGLAKAFGRDSGEVCAIGSVKSNIGHLEAAAGIAGITKVLLQMQHGEIVPSLHSETLNPHIKFEETPFRVQRELAAWTGPGRRAGISSFGAGGSNAHILLESVDAPVSPASGRPCLVVLSAASAARLDDAIGRLAARLDTATTPLSLDSIAYTLQAGREAMSARVAVVAASVDDLRRQLTALRDGSRELEGVFRGDGTGADAYGPLVEGEAGEAFLRVIVEQGDLAKLARLWVAGVAIDWRALYPHGTPRRVSLPGYAFEARRCWFDLDTTRVGTVVPVAQPEALAAVERVAVEPLPAPTPAPSGGRRKIVLQDPSAIGAAPASRVPVTLTPLPEVPHVTMPAVVTATPAPVLASAPIAAPSAPRVDVKPTIVAELSRVLLMSADEVDPRRSFMDLGVDSVLGVELISQINARFGLQIDATKLYDYPSADRLAEFVETQIAASPAAVAPAMPAARPVVTPEPLPIPEPVSAPVSRVMPAASLTSGPAPVAIVGMAGKFPGADDLDGFWKNLRDGVCSVTEVPAERWSIAEYYDRDPRAAGKSYCKSGGFLSDADKFDALFFNVSPADAEVMDPQQRLFLETAWAALEDAGYSDRMLSGARCGAYVGVMGNEYLSLVGEQKPAQAMLGNSMAILPARIAYLLNLKGPVMALDTACSSSLVALHQACNSLRAGEADLMLAGGVTLYLTEKPYVYMSKGGMLSPDGLCKAFDDRANGFVPGEGVAVVVLKLLDRAIADGDPIHGVILGSGVNQDGRTNGMTAPSADSQRDLEVAVYERFAIDPGTISYVEAHGTGTKLGDPIEIDALTQAFRRFTDRTGFCGIGSVKSNVGHTSAAAGVAGLIKVLLSMKHRELPPTLHFSKANHHVRFDSSPFTVQTALAPWTASPMRAGVSSFGFSGTNSHLVVEAPPALDAASRHSGPFAFVLSARTPEALDAAVARLRDFVEREPRLPALASMAWTLQAGRTTMDHRLALVASDVSELRELLGRVVEGRTDGPGVYRGSGPTLGPAPGRFDVERMAQLWATGVAVDWATLYGGQPPRRVALPTYPFARERHWVQASPSTVATPAAPGTVRIAADAPCLRDHVVGGRRILAGAVYLELARSEGSRHAGQPIARLRDVAWHAPLVADGQVVLPFRFEAAGDALQFRAGTYCDGRLEFGDTPAPPAIDISAIRRRCPASVAGTQWYARLAERGLHYGPSFQTVQRVEHGATEAFAMLASAGGSIAERDVLPPGMLDGALQTVAALVGDEAMLPAGIGALAIHAPVPDLCFVHARTTGGDARTRRFDIDLVDELGRAVVTIRDFVLRSTGDGETLYYVPVWREAPATGAPAAAGDPVILFDRDPSTAALLGARLGVRVEPGHAGGGVPDAGRFILVSRRQAGESIEDQLGRSILPLFHALKSARGAEVLVIHDGDAAATALSAFLKTVRREQPALHWKSVEIDDWSRLAEIACQEIGVLDGGEVRYRAGRRWVRALDEIAAPPAQPRLRRGGVYLITGGGGGLGQIVASYLAREWQARVIVAGRGDAPAGVIGDYRRVDVTSSPDVRRLVSDIVAQYGELNGVFHAAGVLRDGLLTAKTERDLWDVIAPKVAGAINLLDATGGCALDVFAAFSSIAAVLGNAGQSDYAYANAFVDALVAERGGACRSINWPLWQDGGMRVDGQIEAMLGAIGVTPLSTRNGLDALVRGLSADQPQIMVLHGRRATLERAVAWSPAPRRDAAAAAEPQALEADLARAIATILKIELAALDVTRDLTLYGVDSIGFMEIAAHLNRAYGIEVPPTIVFEYPSVRALAAHLCESYAAQLGVQPTQSLSPSHDAVPDEPVTIERLPLSHGQQALWFLHQMEPDSAAYHVAFYARVLSPFDAGAFARALQALAARHEVLRASFGWRDGELTQNIPSVCAVPLITVDASGRSQDELKTLVQAAYRAPFDLEHQPPVRAHVFSQGATEHVLLLTIHHIVVDAWSLWILVGELGKLHEAEAAGRPLALPPVSRAYRDFVRWQRDAMSGDRGAEQWNYWRAQLAAPRPMSELLPDRPRPGRRASHGASFEFVLPDALSRRLKGMAQEQGVTPFVLLLSAFYIWLHRTTGEHDLAIGSPLSGRSQPEFSQVVGYFVNPVVLRADLSGDPTVADVLTRVRRVVFDAIKHQDFPFPMAVERLQPERDPDPSRSPLFQICFVFQNVPGTGGVSNALIGGATDTRWGGLQLAPFPMTQQEGQFDLTLDLMHSGDGFAANVTYNPDLFDRETIARMSAQLQVVLDDMAGAAQQPISRLRLLPEDERREVVEAFNATARPYALDEPLHRLLGIAARRHADQVALVFEGHQLTYAGLEARANRLGNHLRSLGVGPDVVVGVCLERSLDLVIALCGILKAGGAYLPLETHAPSERLAFMINDAKCPVVITQEALRGHFDGLSLQTLCMDRDWPLVALFESDPPPVDVTPDHLAYVIYTSGTTGQPKGVMNTHRGICNRLIWMQEAYRLTPADRVLQKTPYTFDVSVWEFFWPLLNGATLVIAPPDAHRDGAQLVDIIERDRITTLHFVPSMLRLFLEERRLEACESLKRVICSGEALPADVEARFFTRFGCELHNLYGPTEAAVDVTFYQCRPGATHRSVPIGRPVANTQIHILDRHLNPVPIGVAGELHIGGIQVARGYLNRPELTMEKFIADPFSADPSARLYKSGDLARFLADGNVEYLGRLDHQLKIRGVRVEPGEIEAALNRHPGVRESAVIGRAVRGSDLELVAYYVPVDTAPSDGALKAHLTARLPEALMPAFYQPLARLPLSANGKLDRRALPEPAPASAGEGGAPVQTGTEAMVAAIWAEVLHVASVSRDDNFFRLGGHSLLAMQIIGRVRERIGADLRVGDLFNAPTVAAFAERVDASRQPLQMEAAAVPGEWALSFAQERLWFLAQLAGAEAAYNVPLLLNLSGVVDVARLGDALSAVIARHPALRSNIRTRDGRPELVVSDRRIVLETLTAGTDEEARRLIEARVVGRFDLATELLMRASLVERSAAESTLVIVLHHAVCDGWSLGILMNEVWAAYTGAPLQPPPMAYPEWAARQRQELAGPVVEQQTEYWRRRLAGAPALLELPTDRPRPAAISYAGGLVPVTIDAGLAAGLRAVSREAGASLFMTLVAAFAVLLRRYSGQDDILVGSPVSGRHDRASESVIGLFVNTIVLRTDLSDNPSFATLLERVRTTALEAYAHETLPFERVLSTVAPARSLSHAPLFQVMCSLQNESAPLVAASGLTVTPMLLDGAIAKFDLTLDLTDSGEAIRGAFEYSKDLFDAPTIERMAEQFVGLLAAVTSAPGRRIDEIVIGETEAPAQLEIRAEWTPVFETIAARAAAAPDALAIVAGETRWTYRELIDRARGVANRLREQGAGRGAAVGVMAGREPDAIAHLLGVFAAGAVAVPLDPRAPGERNAFITSDAGIRLVAEGSGSSSGPTFDPPAGTDAAYIIYTSGSTGRPKGVAVSHGAIARHCARIIELYGLGAGDRVLQSTSMCFDAALEQILPTLMTGATLVIAPAEPWTPAAFARIAQETGLTVADVPPAYLHELLLAWSARAPAPMPVRLIVVGGDVLTPATVELWRGSALGGARLLNMYGPTEATISATAYEVPASGAVGRVPIGRPLPGRRAYVVDGACRQVPDGVPGELCLGGDCLAIGYVNQPEQTAAKFVRDPFADEPGARMYRTGDRARRLPDGQIEFLGRADRQVKIRGFRIELDEIESVLAAIPGVAECAVVLVDDVLVGHVAGHADAAEIRAQLLRRLPAYMQPLVVTSASLPHMPGGKIDRRALAALPLPAAARDGAVAVAPRDEIETRLQRIWAAVLGARAIGVRDDFFHAGGHSLLAVRLLAEVEREFGRALPLTSLLQHPATIENQARALREAAGPVLAAGGAPFFCVHPVGAAVLAYRELARHVAGEHPFHAVHVDGQGAASLEAVAARAIETLQTIQPEGPYHLGGWSAGGVLAFEMARQLVARGRQVAALVLIDSLLPGDGMMPLAVEEALIRAHDPAAATEAMLAAAREVEPLLTHYMPAPCDVPVLLVRAADSLRGGGAGSRWAAIAPRLRIHVVPGNHYTMMQEPSVGGWARTVAEFLDAPQGRGELQEMG
jgi:amino acid adenylation domain-containing protein